MPNIASALKEEISRLARKEVRAETDALKKASANHRSTIAALKREVATLRGEVKRLGKLAGKGAPVAKPEDPGRKLRFSAQRLAAHRAKLGMSAKDYGALVGVSGLTIYKWEKGDVRPRAGQLPAIAAVRTLGKRDAAARLAQLA